MRFRHWSSGVFSSDIALILQRIGAQLVDEADPAPLLPQIEQHAPWRVGHRVERGVKLRPAIAFEAAEPVAGQAFAVQPHHRRAAVALADDERDMVRRLLRRARSEEHTYELQSVMRTSYAGLFLEKTTQARS